MATSARIANVAEATAPLREPVPAVLVAEHVVEELRVGRIERAAARAAAVAKAVETFGGIDILVNNAAYQMAQESLSD